MPVEVFTVNAKGVGRKDYSSMIEHSVEPVIRSYQEDYSYWDTITVAAGAQETKDVEITTGYVVLLYDFFASIPTNQLISLSVFAVSDAAVARIIEVSKHGSIDAHIAKGVPFFQTIRFRLENMGGEDIDINFGTLGIITSRETYFLLAPLTPRS